MNLLERYRFGLQKLLFDNTTILFIVYIYLSNYKAASSYIIIWRFDAGRVPISGGLDEEEESAELWSTHKTLRGHIEDVSDLSWSADATKLASCGIDHTVIIWEVESVRVGG